MNAPAARQHLAAPDPDAFIEAMDRELIGWDDPSMRLRNALDNDELTLFAQPIVRAEKPGVPCFAEVLVRMREEEAALLPPGEFLPVFEHYGMMPELDRWVARHAIAGLAGGLSVQRLTINVSSQTFSDADFVPFVVAELACAGLQPSALVFEIDEVDLLKRPESAVCFAAALKAAGCALLVDGFGRRSVSFTPLTRLKADFIKVDGVIVRKLHESEIARGKLATIVRVAEVIGAGVIGECVEEPAALQGLRNAGAGYAQGFGLFRPEPLENLRKAA